MREDAERDGLYRRGFISATAGALAAGSLSGLSAAETSESSGHTVTLVHDTHFHGRFQDASDPALNIARYYTEVEKLLAEHDNAAYVGIGDDLAPSLMGLEYQGEHMIEALNEMDLAVNGAGNHEFDFGVDVAQQRFENSQFPWVVANLLTDEGDPVPGTERWTTIDIGEATIGVFGMVSEGFKSLTDYPDDWQVLDNVEAAREAVSALESEGVDFTVLASHVSQGANQEIAAEVDGVDAVVGSHSGVTFEQPQTAGDSVVSEFGDEFGHIGRLTFDVESGDLVDWERVDLYNSEAVEETPTAENDNHRKVDVQNVTEHSALKGLIGKWRGDLEERLGKPYFESEVELDATFDNYARETALGNLITDAMRQVGDIEADVAIQNAGGIRSNSTYGPGEITGLDVMNVLPFPNTIEVYELTGEQLRTYLENSVRPLPSNDFGAQPAIQVSGLQYEWRGHDDESEVLEVYVNDEPLDPEETYLVSTNNFVAGRSVIGEGEPVLRSDQTQGPFVLDKLQEMGTVSPEIENRMLRVDERLGEGDVEYEDGEFVVSVPEPESSEGIVEDSFSAVVRTGDEDDAESATADGGASVRFGEEQLMGLATSVSDPSLRVFGSYDPDEEYYGYTNDEGETMELPVSSGYDYYRLKLNLPVDSLEAAAPTPTPTATDTPTDTATEASMDGTSTGTSTTEGSPGFGAAAGAAGAAGAAYLYTQRGDDENDSEE